MLKRNDQKESNSLQSAYVCSCLASQSHWSRISVFSGEWACEGSHSQGSVACCLWGCWGAVCSRVQSKTARQGGCPAAQSAWPHACRAGMPQAPSASSWISPGPCLDTCFLAVSHKCTAQGFPPPWQICMAQASIKQNLLVRFLSSGGAVLSGVPYPYLWPEPVVKSTTILYLVYQMRSKAYKTRWPT